MSAFAVVLLVADLVGVALVVVHALRERPRDEEPARTFRRCRLAGTGLAGLLIALVALGATDLGTGVAVALTALALFAGFLGYLATLALRPYFNRPARIWTWISTGIATTGVVALVLLLPRPSPKAEDLDTARFGVPIDRHVAQATAKMVNHPPTLADVDADVAGPEAVPVERWALDGQRLTLVVAHRVTCVPTVVLLRADVDTLHVMVVYYPTSAASSGCRRPDPPDLYAARSVVEVDLPGGLRPAELRDVGARGPATRVSTPPKR